MTLYRKYRPQTFAQLAGQQHIRITLQRELSSGSVAHAYLFAGPRGVGKTTTARLLAKAVNCLNLRDGEPCLQCTSCQAIQAGSALDLLEIDAASHTQVDHVRETILPTARTAPSASRKKVFIIDEVHMLSVAAFNALLKMLEEPPAHVMFILATTEIHRVPETIISRCQRFDFHRIAHQDLATRIRWIAREEEVRVDDDVVDAIADAADGSLRDAEVTLGQLIALGEQRITRKLAQLMLPMSDWDAHLRLLTTLVKGQTAEGILHLHALQDDGVQLTQFTDRFLRMLRQALLLRVVPASPPTLGSLDDPKRVEELTRLLADVSLERILAWIDLFLTTYETMRRSALPILPLELAVVRATLREDSRGTEPARQVNPPIIRESGVKRSAKTEEHEPPARPTVVKRSGDQPLNERWQRVLTVVRDRNHGLRLLLNLATPTAVSDGALKITVPYAFHAKRLQDDRYLSILQEACTDAFGKPLRLEFTIAESAPTHPQSSSLWDSVVQAFGSDIAKTP